MIKNQRAWIAPLGAFILAMTVAALAAPRVMWALRQEGKCTGIDIPQTWTRETAQTVFGKATSKRAGATLTLTLPRLQQSIVTTREAERRCKEGDKECCVEVFGGNSPSTGNPLTAAVTTPSGNTYPAGSLHHAHYKVMLATKCASGTITQVVFTTVTDENGKVLESNSDRQFQIDVREHEAVIIPDGPAVYWDDYPGRIWNTAAFADKLKEEPVVFTERTQFFTLITCEGHDCAIVSWEVSIEYRLFFDAVICNITAPPASIFCAGGGAFVGAKEIISKAEEGKDPKEKPKDEDPPKKK